MNIIEKNEGVKIAHSLKTNKLTLGDGELTLDLSKLERDFDVHVDVCENAFGMLTMGVSNDSAARGVGSDARRYVAQIDIPARSYIEEDDGEDDEGIPKKKRAPVPFSTNNVTLTLWALGV